MSATDHPPLDSVQLARDILERAQTARTEEDVKMGMEPLLRRAFEEIGIDVNIVAYEKATALTAKRMDAAVLTTWKTPFGEKTVVATDTTSLFTARSVNEAHYLCALLNSGPVDGFVRSFSSGGRGFGAPAVVKDLAIPPFDPQSRLHLRLARLSREAHEAVAADRDCAALEVQMDEAAEELWTTKP